MARARPKPLYIVIIEALKAKIASGDLRKGDRLPSESALAAEHGVSRITSKRALEEMEHEGLIDRIQGSGSYLKPQAVTVRTPEARLATDSLALLLPFDSTKGRAIDTIKGANDFLHERGFLLTVHISNYDPEQERNIIRRLVESHVRGLILYPYSDRQNIDVLFKLDLRRFAVVTIDKYYERVPIPAVVTDNSAGSYAATQHLIEHGHRSIGFSSAHNVEENVASRERYFAYCKALSDNGITPKDSYFISAPEIRNTIDVPTFRGVLRQFLDRPDPVTAIQAVNDYEAISLLKAALSMGVRVPEQLSLVGFDNLELSEHVEVPLTTVEQDFHQIGYQAAQMLVDQLEGKTDPAGRRVAVLPATLIRRQSVSAPRRDRLVLPREGKNQ